MCKGHHHKIRREIQYALSDWTDQRLGHDVQGLGESACLWHTEQTCAHVHKKENITEEEKKTTKEIRQSTVAHSVCE